MRRRPAQTNPYKTQPEYWKSFQTAPAARPGVTQPAAFTDSACQAPCTVPVATKLGPARATQEYAPATYPAAYHLLSGGVYDVIRRRVLGCCIPGSAYPLVVLYPWFSVPLGYSVYPKAKPKFGLPANRSLGLLIVEQRRLLIIRRTAAVDQESCIQGWMTR